MFFSFIRGQDTTEQVTMSQNEPSFLQALSVQVFCHSNQNLIFCFQLSDGVQAVRRNKPFLPQADFGCVVLSQ